MTTLPDAGAVWEGSMSGRCAIGTTPRKANMYKAPGPAQRRRLRQGRGRRRKRLSSGRASRILQMFVEEKRIFIASSVGISVLVRSVNLIQECATIYRDEEPLCTASKLDSKNC